MKRSIVFVLLSLLILIGGFSIVRNLVRKNSEGVFSKNVSEVVYNIEKDKSEIDYSEYVDVEMVEPKVVMGDKSEEVNECHLQQGVIITNKSEEVIKIHLKVFLPKELITSIVYAPVSFGPVEEIELEPGKIMDIGAQMAMKPLEELSVEEKEIFDEHSKHLYIEFVINGKKAYTRL